MTVGPFSFESPWWLLALLTLPALWVVSFRALANLPAWRQGVAVALRSLLVLLLVAALAEIQWVQATDRVAVIYLVDRSLSVPPERIARTVDYLDASTRRQADPTREDRAGVIVFGRDATIELPPTASRVVLPGGFEAPVDREATDLEGAIRLAKAAFPEDCARRLVIISDGNQNVGDVLREARAAAESGIGIDVVPLTRDIPREVGVEKVVLPGNVRKGTPFDVRVVIRAFGQAEEEPARGKLQIFRVQEQSETIVAEEEVEIANGKRVFTVREPEITQAGFFTYRARFVPEEGVDDAHRQNNEATAFTHVRGQGRVLLIENAEQRGQFDFLVARLREQNIEVTKQSTAALYASLAELQPYDAVILANVPRVTDLEGSKTTQFTDDQIEMLVRNTQQLGSGLIMLGGPQSFGAGGWANTRLEEAMPIDFQVKNAKVVPVGALMLVIDISGSMDGEKLAMSKVAAAAAVKVLSSKDSVGVVGFDEIAHWIVRMQTIGDRSSILSKIGKMGSGGGTNMEPGMRAGYDELATVESGVKHMIVLSDGQTGGSGYAAMAQRQRALGVTTTCVAVGGDADAKLLGDVATAGGGKLYRVNNPKAIPRIFMKEAMRVARPLVYEDGRGIHLRRASGHEMLAGLDQIPPITGFVLSQKKQNPLVEILLTSPKPASEGGVSSETNTVLASWQYGLGRTVAFTTDAGRQWARAWPRWSGYDRFHTQIVRWAMRPTVSDGTFDVATETEDGRVQIVVTALDRDANFVNFLEPVGSVIRPDMAQAPLPLKLRQTAPGRYVGSFAATDPGNYFYSVSPNVGAAPLLGGVNVPYSSEFDDAESNRTLLEALAELKPAGGSPGQVIPEPEDAETLQAALETNLFRRDLQMAVRLDALWPLLLVIAAATLFVDVLNRRVVFGLAWMAAAGDWLARLFGRPETERGERLHRLKARRESLRQSLDSRRAGARFEPQIAPADGNADDRGAPPADPAVTEQRESRPAESLAAAEEPESYTSRLLRAKRQARKS